MGSPELASSGGDVNGGAAKLRASAAQHRNVAKHWRRMHPELITPVDFGDLATRNVRLLEAGAEQLEAAAELIDVLYRRIARFEKYGWADCQVGTSDSGGGTPGHEA